MAGKKKTAGAPSKTARASMRGRGKAAGFERAPDSSLFLSLNRGRNAYVFDSAGKTRHMAVGSDAFNAAAVELLTGDYANRAHAELTELDERFPGVGWAAPIELAAAAAVEEEPAAT